MKYPRTLITVTQFCAVMVLSLCGTLSLLNSGLYASLEKGLHNWLGSYLAWLILGLMLALGGFLVLFKNKGGGILAVIAAVLSLPSILSFNSLDLLKIVNGTSHITTHLTFTQVMATGCLIISSYFLLDLTRQVKANESRFKARGASAPDLAAVSLHQLLISIILAGSALLASLIMLAISRGFEALFSKTVLPVSWWIVPAALFCIFVLGIYLFWIATRKNA
jgi:hypothetical protein